MSSISKGLIVLGTIFLLGIGLLAWKIRTDAAHQVGLNKITAEDIALILKDENPMQLKQLADNPEQKKALLSNLKQYLAIGAAAKREGVADREDVKRQLEEIRLFVTARNYDQFKNKDKGPMPPFGFITEDQVNEFYSDPTNEAKFEQSYAAQIADEKKNKRIPEDQEPSEEEKKNDRSMFGKIHIYEKEVKELSAAGQLPEDWKRKTELMVGLQQTQFLVSKYAQEVLTKKVEVTEDDVKKYIAEHPELQSTGKEQKAQEILARVKSGEDFAAIAKEVSDDPGSKESGGLYKGITKGQFVPEFEEAALAVQPGEIVDRLVKSKFGYHIIKLEARGQAKDKGGKDSETYDARHILISTGVKDPENPMSPEMPAEDFVKAKLQKDKRKAVLDQIIADNPVEVPDDFTVPQPSEEDIKKMMEQQMQPGQGQPGLPGSGKEASKPAAPKKK